MGRGRGRERKGEVGASHIKSHSGDRSYLLCGTKNCDTITSPKRTKKNGIFGSKSPAEMFGRQIANFIREKDFVPST